MSHKKNTTLRLGSALVAASILGLAGCGDAGRGGVEVSGSVTLNGAPMPAGSVVFVPSGKGHKCAGEIVDGTFRIEQDGGPIPGSYRVEVYAPDTSGVPLDDPLAYAKSGARIPGPNPVAARFNTHTTLEANVTADGVNSFAFHVESVKK